MIAFRNYLVFIGLSAILTARLCAQESGSDASPDSLRIDNVRLGIVAGGTAVALGVGYAVQEDLWWKGEPSPFHINTTRDYLYALNADKVGHMQFTYTATTVYGELFRWCNMDSATAIWAGAILVYAHQTFVECRDGFSRAYGFSWGDFAANTVGASFPILQHYVPALRPIDLQISFYPSEAYDKGYYRNIIDDYTSTYYWAALSIYDWMPASVQEWYPPWLGVALGYSVENTDWKGGGNHALYLSLDWNLSRIKGLPDWLHSVFRLLHLYHLPAPAVKIYPEVVWYGLKF
jgi:hypothetical protein